MENYSGLVLQPGYGDHINNSKPGSSMGGTLSLAKVIKVHHKNNTVDVQLIRSKHIISSSPDSEIEGKYGPRMLNSSAHFSATNLNSSGTVEPIQEGQVVLIGFVDNSVQQPVILGSVHNTYDVEKNILVSKYPLDTSSGDINDIKEGLKFLKVFPSQFYMKVDGIGGVEVSHPSKSFFKADADSHDMNDDHKGFDHKDLSEKNKFTGETLSSATEVSAFNPSLLYVHRTSYEDENTTWTKIFLDSQGMFRLTRDLNDDSLSYIQISEDGGLKARRQEDNPKHESGEIYSEISITESGETKLKRKNEKGETEVEITEDGNLDITHYSGSTLRIEGDNGDISISHTSGSIMKFESNGDIIIKPAGKLYLD